MADSAPVPTAEPTFPPTPPAPDPLTLAAARDIGWAVIDRLNPSFRHGALPPEQWLLWMGVFVAIAAVPWFILMEWVPRAGRWVATRRSGGSPPPA